MNDLPPHPATRQDVRPDAACDLVAPPHRGAAPLTRGVHHLALTTEDMKMTTDFYVDVLGMPLVHAMKVPPGLGTGDGNRGNPPFENIRHYFFDMGGDSVVAFFEIPRGEKSNADRNAIGGMQHLAFSISAENFIALRRRLLERSVPVDGPIEIMPGIFSIYFYDPNGIRLEACCKPDHGAVQRVIAQLEQPKSVAWSELQTLHGERAWLDHVTENLARA